MRIAGLLLLGLLAFTLLVIPGIMAAPVKAQDATVIDTPVADPNVTVTETPVPTQTPAPDQNVTVTETPVPTQTPVPDQNVTVTETPVPTQTPAPDQTAVSPVAPAGMMTITLDNHAGFPLHIGENDWTSGITIDTTYSSWYVKVTDSSGSAYPGYMTNMNDPSVHLANPLLVKSLESSSYENMVQPLTIWSGTTPGTFTETFCVRQDVGKTDKAGLYGINFEFLGGPL